MQSKLMVITGHPGSGKTTLAKQLADKYKLVYISKDALKERIFDGLGSSDKEWSLKVSGVAHRIMDDMVQQELGAGHSVIVESNFKPEIDSERFSAMASELGAECVQILCTANADVLFERWNKRIQTGERHEGHVEAISLDEIRHDLSLPYAPLQLPGQLTEVDTTDFNAASLPDLSL